MTIPISTIYWLISSFILAISAIFLRFFLKDEIEQKIVMTVILCIGGFFLSLLLARSRQVSVNLRKRMSQSEKKVIESEKRVLEAEAKISEYEKTISELRRLLSETIDSEDFDRKVDIARAVVVHLQTELKEARENNESLSHELEACREQFDRAFKAHWSAAMDT
jgi:hypothetical protein